MLVVISHLIRADHEEVEGIVREAFHGIGKEGVEVQVVATRSPTRFSGRAWSQPPARRGRDPQTRWLVEVVMPARPPADGYPLQWKYPKLKTAPVFTADDWRDQLFAVAAHEAYHVKQFRMGMRRSEVAAERWAYRALERNRSGLRPEAGGSEGNAGGTGAKIEAQAGQTAQTAPETIVAHRDPR